MEEFARHGVETPFVKAQEWLDVGVSYSPDAARYFYDRGLVGVSAESLGLNLQHRVIGKLSAASGVLYCLGGPAGLDTFTGASGRPITSRR